MKRPMPPVVFLVIVIFMVVSHLYLPLHRVIAWPYTLLGFVPIVFGLLIGIWALGFFRRARTTMRPFQKSTSLVTGGPFRFSRNPMYLGGTAMLAGLALYFGTLAPMLLVPVFVAVLTAAVIPAEEKMLEEAFGDAYREYCRRTRRWI